MNPYKGTRLLTRKKHILIQIGFWLYTVIWFGISVFAIFRWHSLFWYYKVLLFIFFVFLVPFLGDLTESYESYRKKWEEVNLDTKTNKKRAG